MDVSLSSTHYWAWVNISPLTSDYVSMLGPKFFISSIRYFKLSEF